MQSQHDVKLPRLKWLDRYMLQNFVPLFCMTFFICLFIVLLQFLWRFINDLVGKGVGFDVLGELFFYAALTMVPMALPLAILLASLMTFGNMGERVELTAIKSAGISLLRAMTPITIVVAAIAVGAFFFQNDVLPIAQTKMYTLLYSMKQKSPELEIPEGTFYDRIPGYNIFVDKKNRDTGMLYKMMIYDLSDGFDNASVILADSGRLAFSADKTHLYLHLWEGESFENLKDANSRELRNVPYRREAFKEKELIVPFDANFNRMDEEGMRNQYVGKNIAELRETIESIQTTTDSIGLSYGTEMKEKTVMGMPYKHYAGMARRPEGEETEAAYTTEADIADPVTTVNPDSVFRRGTTTYHLPYVTSALNKMRRQQQEVDFRAMDMKEQLKSMRRHDIELQKKFTLALACIIFFFIGAPLGAIIRKGGLGLPIVISVVLFIFYYIIDNIGQKTAREGRWAVWQGVWLSTVVLLPLGIFLTWKAVNDSAVFNPDTYYTLWRKLTGYRPPRAVALKEVVIEPIEPTEAVGRLENLIAEARAYLPTTRRPLGYRNWAHGAADPEALQHLAATLDETIDYLSDAEDYNIIAALNAFPNIGPLKIYAPVPEAIDKAWTPVGLAPILYPAHLIARRYIKALTADIEKTITNAYKIIDIINHESNPS